jgi:hypothetical protein
MTRIQSAYQAELRHQASLLRQQVDTLPRGRARDALLQQAQRLERSAILEGWACSELRPPKEDRNKTHNQPNLA